MPKRLKDIRIAEVSLVDDPANPSAFVQLFKREREEWLKKMAEAMTTAEVLEHDEMMDEFWKTHNALMQSIYSIMNSEAENKNELMKQSIKEFMTAMSGIDFSKKEGLLKEGSISQFFSKIGKALGMSEAEVAEMKKEIAEPVKENPEEKKTMPEDTVTKADLDAIQKKAQEDVAKAHQAAAEAIAKAQKLEEELSMERFTKHAEERYPSIPGEPKEKGRLLKSLHDKLGKEDAEAVEQMLAAGEAAMKAAKLFTAQGKDGFSSLGSAWDEIQKKADALVAEKKVPTREQGVDMVMKQNPELYRRYIEENGVQ